MSEQLPVVKLKPVELSNVLFDQKNGQILQGYGHVNELIVCTRPGRIGEIPNMSAEIKNKKIIAHCYGHGRVGWSLLWGSVEKTLQEFQKIFENGDKTQKITVIGAGCVGLWSAIRLNELGFTNIGIITKQIEGIASMNAGGLFSTHSEDITVPENVAVVKEIAAYSYNIYEQIWHKTHLIKKGVNRVYVFGGAEKDYGAIETLTGMEPLVEDGIIPPPELVMVDFGNGKKYRMNKFVTFQMNGHLLMEEFLHQIKIRGIPIKFETVNSFDDIDSPIIFNCSGIGGKILNNDDKILPIVGHLIQLQNQDIDNQSYIMLTKYAIKPVSEYKSQAEIPTIYYMPKRGGVLGGTFIRNYDGKDQQLNHNEFHSILERCRHFFGSNVDPKPKL